MPIVESLLDTDLYKLTMMQFVLHQFPDVNVRYKFKCRTEGVPLTKYYGRINDEISQLDKLRFRDDELFYLRNLRFIKSDFVEFLKLFKLNYRNVKIVANANTVHIEVEGPWLHTILYEIPILKIVNEVVFEGEHPFTKELEEEGLKRLDTKLCSVRGTGIRFADFGTRRAYSRRWQEMLIENIFHEVSKGNLPEFIGTSNVLYAFKYGLKPIGTMAHEVFQVCQALTRVSESQSFALQKWADEYRGDLGIALTDTLGIDKFLADFDMYFAKLFDGVRQDSGKPEEWFDKMLAHYISMNIDPTTKTAIFSDGLDFERIKEIHKYVNGRMNDSYGIGTNLTNDLGPKAIQIVMKVVEANGQPVAKISDSPGKEMCEDEDYVSYLRKVIR